MGEPTGYEHLTETRKEWSARARCGKLSLAESKEMFEQKQGRPLRQPPWRDFCNGCPVKQNCFAYAVVHEEDGIWGGQTKRQRNKISPLVRTQMTEQAIRSGWLEYSVEIVLAPTVDFEFDFPDLLFA